MDFSSTRNDKGMKKIIFLFVITLLIFFPNASKAEDMVTVRLEKDIGKTSTLHMRLSGDYFTPDLGLTLHEGVNYKLFIKKWRTDFKK